MILHLQYPDFAFKNVIQMQFEFSIYEISLQIVFITVPGFLINYTLILWYLASVNKLLLKTTPWLLFSAILVSLDPMLTSSAIKDLGRYISLFFPVFFKTKHNLEMPSLSVATLFPKTSSCHW